MKKLLAIALATLMVLACFAGCGAKKDEEVKTVVVGYTIYAPMNYFEGDELVGFDTDLAKAVTQQI